ncbi:MAG TPA: hypothetical protein VMR23_12980 [Candidatus Limnocylindria bacterium]|nr:hypothetical protein [Candidatus Limnocylindria bacterium]
MLHVLNGDATASVFGRAGIPGHMLVWRDILCEGPVVSVAGAERAADLARHLEIDAEDYLRAWREGQAALAAAASVSLVFPSLDDVRGLGAADPAQLSTLFEARRRLGADAIARGRAAWQAYTSATPAAPRPRAAGRWRRDGDVIRAGAGAP